MNNYFGNGRVIAIRTPNFNSEKTVLELTVSVNTGQRKKEDQEYPPSMIFQFLVWDKTAELVQDNVQEGSLITFSGKLGEAQGYTSADGEIKVKYTLHQVDDIRPSVPFVRNTEGGAAAPAAPAAASTSTSRRRAATPVAPVVPEWESLGTDDLF